MSDVKIPKNYQRSGGHRNLEVSIGDKVIPMIPIEHDADGSGTFSFVGWRPVKNVKLADGTVQKQVQASGVLTDKMSDALMFDYLSRRVVTPTGTVDADDGWIEHYPVATRGENKGLERELPVHQTFVEGEILSGERHWNVTSKVALKVTADGENVLTVLITPEGQRRGRVASGPVTSDDDF